MKQSLIFIIAFVAFTVTPKDAFSSQLLETSIKPIPISAIVNMTTVNVFVLEVGTMNTNLQTALSNHSEIYRYASEGSKMKIYTTLFATRSSIEVIFKDAAVECKIMDEFQAELKM